MENQHKQHFTAIVKDSYIMTEYSACLAAVATASQLKWHEIWPWFSSRTLCGITGMKGPSLCLSASNSARYLQKDRNIPISHHSSRVVQHASLTNIKFSKNRIAWKSREIPPTYTWKRTVTGSQTQASKHWALVQKNRVKVRREATLTKKPEISTWRIRSDDERP